MRVVKVLLRFSLALATLTLIYALAISGLLPKNGWAIYVPLVVLAWYNGKANGIIERIITGHVPEVHGRRKDDVGPDER